MNKVIDIVWVDQGKYVLTVWVDIRWNIPL